MMKLLLKIQKILQKHKLNMYEDSEKEWNKRARVYGL